MIGAGFCTGLTTILPAGTAVESEFNLDIVRATYSYSFLQDDRLDLALLAGLYVMPVEFKLEAQGFGNLDESFNITAPLPLFGLRADFLLTPRWYLRNRLNLFYLELGDYSGGMRELSSSVEWRATKWLGLGAGVESFGLGLKAKGDTGIPGVNFNGEVKFGYAGVVLYARGFI